MADFLRVVYEGVTDFSPNELMGALMIGLAMALACYGICLVGRKFSTNPLPLLCGLFFVVSILSMAIGFGQSRSRSNRQPNPNARANHNPGPGGQGRARRFQGAYSAFPPMGKTLVHEADLNRDGMLTPDEAAQFVIAADKDGKGWVGPFEVDHAQASRDGSSTAEILPVPNLRRPD